MHNLTIVKNVQVTSAKRKKIVFSNDYNHNPILVYTIKTAK